MKTIKLFLNVTYYGKGISVTYHVKLQSKEY